jgi:2-amino-4-hydroxy-6-hydroxymethyldihydropteridine diphosphokinase
LSTDHVAAIALGSNLASNLDSATGDRAANLRTAIEHLGAFGTLVAVSSFYDTAPVGYLDQPRFLNAAALLATTLPPLELLDRLLDIERSMGRDRSATVPKGPRVIDLDLLLYGEEVIETTTLTLPHPALRERRFVLEPLAEIAPNMFDPVTGLRIAALLALLAD